MALRCIHCGEVVPDDVGAPPAELERGRWHGLRSLCPECLDPDQLLALSEGGEPKAERPRRTAGARCPACGRVGTLRRLRPREARTYRACFADGYSADLCARMVMVRFGLGA